MAVGKHIANRSRFVRQGRHFLVWIVLVYLRLIARLSLVNTKAISIGIAGSVGKSTVRKALSTILSPQFLTLEVSGNSETGIPLGLLGLDIGKYRVIDWLRVMILAPFRVFGLRHYQYLIVEMGIDGPKAPKNMSYLLTIIKPKIGILLPETPAHTEHYESLFSPHKTPEENLQTVIDCMTEDDGKLLTTSSCQLVIVDADDPVVEKFAEQHIPSMRLETVGHHTKHDASILNYHVSLIGTVFDFRIHTHRVNDSVHLVINGSVLPEEAGSGLAATVLIGVHLGIPLREIETRMNKLTLPSGRGTLFTGLHNTTIIDSTYNATPASVSSFLSVVKFLKKETRRPTVFLFGDMKELGILSEIEHKNIARHMAGIIDHVVCVGPLAWQFVMPMIEKKKQSFKSILWCEGAKEAGEYLKTHLPNNAIVLAKGSQFLEEALKFLIPSNDVNRLPRQDTFWKEMKIVHGQWV